MSEFDAIRNSRRQRGQDARERVLNRVYSPSSNDSEAVSEFQSIRNRPLNIGPPINNLGGVGNDIYGPSAPTKELDQSLPSSVVVRPKTKNIKNPQDMLLMSKLQPKPKEQPKPLQGYILPDVQKDIKHSDIPVSMPMTVYDMNKEKYKDMPAWQSFIPNLINGIVGGNPIGESINRATYIPGVSVGAAPETGNKTVDSVTGWVGENIAPLAVPSGAPLGSGTLAAPYTAAESALSSKAGQKAVDTLAKAVPKASPEMAQKIARGALTEGIAGTVQAPAQTLLMNSGASGNELLESTAFGAGGGFLIGGAAPLIGAGLKGLKNRAFPSQPKAVDDVLHQNVQPPTTPEAPKKVEVPEPLVEPVSQPHVNEQVAPARTDDIPEFLVRRTKRTPEPVERIETKLPEATAVDPADSMKQDWFTDLFGNQGVGIKAGGGLKTADKGPLTTAEQIVNSPIKNDLKGLVDSTKAKARAIYQDYIDRLDPLKRINNNTYDAAMDSARADNIANTIIRDKFVTPEGEVVGESLNNIFKKVARGQDKAFVDYITLRHAETRMARGERVYAEKLGMTEEKVRQRIEMYDKKYPGFKDIAAEWDNFNDNVLRQIGVKEGLISPAAYESMREKNPYYSPMRRQFSKSEKPGRKFLQKTTSSSFTGQKAPIKEVSPTGSVRNIVDPRRTITEAVGAWTNAAMRNRVMQSMVDAIKRNPKAFEGIAEIVKRENDKTNLNKLLSDGGVDDFIEALDSDFQNLFKTTKANQDNIVRAMVKGQPVYVQVHDPEIVKTLLGMGPQASNVLIDVLSAFSNATKRGATGLFAPVFAIKGATMDLVQSAIQAKNPAKQAGYTVYAILSGIGEKLNIPGLKNMAEEYRRSGGGYSAAIKGERKLNTNISDMTRSPLLSPQGIAKGLKKTVSAPFKALEAIGDITENAPRMAAYKLEMNRLGGERTPENVRQAMNEAREITINFSRRGAKSREIESLVPYNNAAVQGTYRVLRQIKQHPVKTAAAIGTLAVLPKMMEYFQFHDDPDYQNLPARERYRFLIVNKNADGTFTKIPMEPAYNSFGEITIEAMRKFLDDDPKAFKGAADAIANVWLPPLATGALQGVTQDDGARGSLAGVFNSTVFAPASAVISNKSFTGAPIVPQSVSGRSPENQYDEKTSAVAKELGKVLKMSPMHVDYLIRSYGGDPARLLLPLTSEVGQGNTRNTLLKNFIVDPQYTTTLTEDFYDAKEKLNQAYNDYTDVGKDLPEWYDDGLRKALNSSAQGSISKQLSYYRDLKRQINSDKSLSAKEKTEKLREAQVEINKIYIDINAMLEESGVINR